LQTPALVQRGLRTTEDSQKGPRQGYRGLNELQLLFDAADGVGDLGLPIGSDRAANQIGDADRPQA